MKLLEYWPFFVGCAAGAIVALFLSSMLRLPETVSLIGFVLLTVIGGGLEKDLIEQNRLPGAVGPGFRPSGGAMLTLLRLPF